MYKQFFLLLSLSSIILVGCGTKLSSDFNFPLHLNMSVASPLAASQTMMGDIWGSVNVHEDGSISGFGVIFYSELGDCIPTIEDLKDPLRTNCALTGVQDGSFIIEGKVLEYTDGKGENETLDNAILASSTFWNYDGKVAPRLISLTFTPETLPLEIYDYWGEDEVKVMAGAKALDYALTNSDFYDTDIELSPVMVTDESTEAMLDAGSVEFGQVDGFSRSEGTMYVADGIPEYAFGLGSGFFDLNFAE